MAAAVASVGTLGLVTPLASATALTWDTNLTPATPSGGSGTWNTSNTNWSNGLSDQAFTSATDNAIFAGTAGSVTLGAGLTTTSLTVSTGGYQFSGTSSTFLQIGTGGFNANGLAMTISGIGLVTDTATWTNTNLVTFSGSVGFLGSRTLTLNNASGTATTFSSFGLNGGNGGSGGTGRNATINGNAPVIINLLSGAINNQAGNPSSSASLAYNGTNTLTINGNNTNFRNSNGQTLTFLIKSGTVALGHDNALGAVDASNNATGTVFEIDGGTVTAAGGARSIANNITLGGNGIIGGSNSLTLSGPVIENASRTLTVNNAAATTLSGSVYLSNDNTTAGRALTMNGSGAVVISGTIANNAVGNSVAAGLTYSGTGSLTLNGTNTFTGGATVSSGVLTTNNLAAAGSASGIGAGSALNIGATGTLRYTGGTLTNFDRNLSGTAGYTIDVTQATTTLTSTATLVSGGLVKAGAGKLVLAGTAAVAGASVTGGTLALAGTTNGFSGSAVIAGGTLQLNNPASSNLMHDAVDVSISSGTFDLNGQSEKIGGLFGSGGEVTNNAGAGTSSTLTVSGFAHSTNYGGVIRDGATGGKVSLVQTDANSATTLSGINLYSGSTSINSATATLHLADNAGLRFVVGASGVSNQINGNGTLILDGDFTLDLTSAGTTLGNSWTLVNNSTLNETYSSTFSVVGFTETADVWRMTTGGGTIYEFQESTGLLQVVPEPGSIGLATLGAAGWMLRRRRRRV